MNGTRSDISPEMKCTSRLKRWSFATTIEAFAFLACASKGRIVQPHGIIGPAGV